MSGAALRRMIERGAREQEAILAAIEAAGLIEAKDPQSRLRIETSRDRLIVMQFIYVETIGKNRGISAASSAIARSSELREIRRLRSACPALNGIVSPRFRAVASRL